jgi:TetR/AcrR family transcriptional regulator
MRQNRNTEQDIVDAARKVFQEKGYKEATMRDIAAEANINMAMLHYYFRCKDNLFYIIFDEAFKLLYNDIINVLSNKELDLFEKIRRVVSEYITFFQEKPYLPQFIIGEIIRNPEKIGNRMQRNANLVLAFKVFSEQLNKEYEKGNVQQISAISLLLNIISLCILPAIAKPMIIEAIGIETTAFDLAIEARKHDVAEFIIKAIKS